jgi:acetyl esterase/lipase
VLFEKGVFMPDSYSPFPNTSIVASLVSGLALATAAAGVALCAPDPAPTHADVSYGPHPHQRIDLYLPPKGKDPYPAVLWFGGIWKPAKHPARLDYFGKAKCAVIAVQTRTMSDAANDKVSAPISYVAQDACRAVQFVRLNAARWDLDPKRIAVGGGSQGALPALYVACAGERADPRSRDPVERVSTRVTCAAAYRSQPSIDPQRMQAWVPGVEWGAPALGCSFKESLKRRAELLPIISRWSPDALLRRGTPPLYFENNWGLTRPDKVEETDYKVHSPAWALGFQKLAHKAGVVCYVKYPGHPSAKYQDIWDFIEQELKAAMP